MVSEERTWYFYRGRGLLEVAGPIGRGQQVVGGSEWVSRCGGGKYPKEYIYDSKHGESLKSRTNNLFQHIFLS